MDREKVVAKLLESFGGRQFRSSATEVKAKKQVLEILGIEGPLSSVKIADMQLGKNDIEFVAKAIASGWLESLTVLKLGPGIGDEGAALFSRAVKAESLNQLEQLTLSMNMIGNEGMSSFCSASGHLSRLARLNLSVNSIGKGGMESFKSASENGSFATLQYLNLDANEIDDDATRALAGARLQSLTELNLFWNKIGDVGVVALAKAPFPKLEKLNLGQNQIKDKGTIDFVKEMTLHPSKLTKLTYLNLSGNNIGEVGIKSLAEIRIETLQT